MLRMALGTTSLVRICLPLNIIRGRYCCTILNFHKCRWMQNSVRDKRFIHTSSAIFNQCHRKLSSDPNKHGVEPLSHESVIRKLARIENSLRFYGYSIPRIGIVVALISGLGLYIFREYIRDNVADEVSSVATRSLGDENVKLKAQELAMALLNAILSDEKIQRQAVIFLQDIFNREDTKDAVVRLLSSVVSDPVAQWKLTTMLKQVLNNSLSDPVFRASLAQNLRYLLQDDSTKRGILELLEFALNDENIRDTTKEFLRDLIASEMVREEAVKLGKNVVHGVVTDNNVQQKAGDGIWSAVGYSVTPRWFGNKQSPPEKFPEDTTHTKSSNDVVEVSQDIPRDVDKDPNKDTSK